MGTVRLLLAIAVLMIHSNGLPMAGGKNAVQCFYLISGFLISYVLIERKSYKSAKDFYINRYLRLYPVYFYVALLSAIYYVIAQVSGLDDRLVDIYRQIPLSASLVLLFSNATLFLQDWLLFLDADDGTLAFTAGYMDSKLPLAQGSLVPQTWSLGLEISFYLLAPFVLTRRTLLFALLATSIIIKIALWNISIGTQEPWTYKFFPAELSLFLAGALSHQLLVPQYQRIIEPAKLAIAATAATLALVLLVLAYPIIPVAEWMKGATLQIALLLLLPLLFSFQSLYSWDKAVGDLSYPLYICHGLIIKVLTFWLAVIGLLEPWVLTALALPLSLMLSHALNVRVAQPLEKIRSRFRAA